MMCCMSPHCSVSYHAGWKGDFLLSVFKGTLLNLYIDVNVGGSLTTGFTSALECLEVNACWFISLFPIWSALNGFLLSSAMHCRKIVLQLNWNLWWLLFCFSECHRAELWTPKTSEAKSADLKRGKSPRVLMLIFYILENNVKFSSLKSILLVTLH